MSEDDDIIKCVIINNKKGIAYPVFHGIGVLLSDLDTNVSFHAKLLESLKPYCPQEIQEVICSMVDRLHRRPLTAEGLWNLEEMDYYDNRDPILDQPPRISKHSQAKKKIGVEQF